MPRNRFRIVTDCRRGYSAQVLFWWFPVMWFQIGFEGLGTNTWETVEDAEAYVNRWVGRGVSVVKEVVPDVN